MPLLVFTPLAQVLDQLRGPFFWATLALWSSGLVALRDPSLALESQALVKGGHSGKAGKAGDSGLALWDPWTLVCWGGWAAPLLGLTWLGRYFWWGQRRWPDLWSLLAWMGLVVLDSRGLWLQWGLLLLIATLQIWSCGRSTAQMEAGPQRLERLRLENSLLPLRWATWAVLALAVIFELGTSMRLAVAMADLTILVALQQASLHGIYRVRAEQAIEVLRHHHKEQEEIRRLHQERERSFQLHRQQAESALLFRQLVGQSSLQAGLPILAQALRPWRSLAFFDGAGDCLWVDSPESEGLRHRSLWSLQWPPATVEPQLLEDGHHPQEAAILVPLASGWFYFAVPSQTNQRSAHWSRAIETLLVAESWLSQRLSDQRSLEQVGQLQTQAAELSENIQVMAGLLHTSVELGRVVALDQLWEKTLGTFVDFFSQQHFRTISIAWLEQQRLATSWGEPLSPLVTSWAVTVPSTGLHYLAASDQERWPFEGPVGRDLSLLALPSQSGTLILAFSGTHSLGQSQLQFVQMVFGFFVQALERIQLQQQLLDSRRLYLVAQNSAAQAQLIAGIAHQLNSPLGAIQLAVQASAARKPDPRLDSALAACQRAQSIISQLFELSLKDKAAPGWLEIEPVLNELIGSQSVHWSVAESDSPLLVWGDRATLERLFLPLLTNALETNTTVEVRLGSDSQGLVWFSVRDAGPGVPSEQRSLLGQPFFTTKKDGKHLGLGLATAQQAALQLRAELHFEFPQQGLLVQVLFHGQESI